MKEFCLLIAPILACFRRSVIKPCYIAFEISALNSTFIVCQLSVSVLGAVVMMFVIKE